jgi:hypothetical protein
MPCGVRPCVKDLECDERVAVLGEELAEVLYGVLGAGGVVAGGDDRVGRDGVDADLGLALDVFQ